MDLVDRANDAAAALLADAIQRQALKAARGALMPCAACYYCGDDVQGKQLFCSLEHGQEWQREQDANRRNGAQP